jgi:hypothetical protein
VAAGGGWGEGETAALVRGDNRPVGVCVATVSQPVRCRNFCPDKFSNLSHDAATPPRLGERPSVSWLVESPGVDSISLPRQTPPPSRGLVNQIGG